MKGYIHSISYFKSCSTTLVDSLKTLGFNSKTIGEFEYLSKCQKTSSMFNNIPFSDLIPTVLSRVLSSTPTRILREWVFVFDFGHVFLIRSQQFMDFDKKATKELGVDNIASARNLRTNLCGKESCIICEYYVLTPLRTVIVSKPSLLVQLRGTLGKPRNEILLPNSVKWTFFKTLQFVQCNQWKNYEKTLVSFTLLANCLRSLTKTLVTDIETKLSTGTYIDSLDEFFKQFTLLYFWTNPEFLKRDKGVFVYMKPWVRKTIVKRLELGCSDQWDLLLAAPKFYSLDIINFTDLVRKTKSCDLSSIQSWRRSINPFRLKSIDLVTQYEGLTEDQKTILHEIYSDIQQRIREGGNVRSQVMEKYFTVNEIATRLGLPGRRHTNVRDDLDYLEDKGFLIRKSADEVKNRRARVKEYYFLNPNFPYHHYLLELFYSLWSREDEKSKDST